MSDHENPPSDLFDAVCRLDDIAEWLEPQYPEEAARLTELSWALKEYIQITFVGDPKSPS